MFKRASGVVSCAVQYMQYVQYVQYVQKYSSIRLDKINLLFDAIRTFPNTQMPTYIKYLSIHLHRPGTSEGICLPKS